MDRRYAPEYGHTNQHGHPDAAGTGSVADTIHDTHRLLGSYPFASATPATQGPSNSSHAELNQSHGLVSQLLII
jgi:hypothetical protein